ncbi:MAG: hypothetical protein ABIK28_15075 [Planctomycetota bacterium]
MNDLEKLRDSLDSIGADFEEMPVLERFAGSPDGCKWFLAVEDTFFLFDEAGLFLGTWNGVTKHFWPRVGDY